jgi:small subunit ribosomal protein S9
MVKKTLIKKRKAAKPKKLVKPEAEKKPLKKTERYFEASGRRKTAVARVRLWTGGEKVFAINGKPLDVYFPTRELCQKARAALEKLDSLDKFRISALVKGGGLNAQAEAVRHGTARALVLFNPDFRKQLKRVGFLTRDPRMRERKKFGLKRARRAPQWQKR